jgi:hypothetical protein
LTTGFQTLLLRKIDMTNDIALLRLAAKAMGGVLKDYVRKDGEPVTLLIHEGVTRHWNPLVFDKDAVHLAVTLYMLIEVVPPDTNCLDYQTIVVRDMTCGEVKVHYGDHANSVALDRYEATRKAIVLAAARIVEPTTEL